MEYIHKQALVKLDHAFGLLVFCFAVNWLYNHPKQSKSQTSAYVLGYNKISSYFVFALMLSFPFNLSSAYSTWGQTRQRICDYVNKA